MTQEEILRMAREAGVYGPFMGEDEDLERFAQLVAKAERERLCAQLRQLHDSLSLASCASGHKRV